MNKRLSNVITFINVSEITEFERIDRNLKNLIVAIDGTIPGSRGFGLPLDSVDAVSKPQMLNEFASELDEKVAAYMPEIIISDINADFDELGSVVSMKVYVEHNRDYKEA